MADPARLAGLVGLAEAPDLSLAEAASAFAAIGSEPRLEVVLALVRAGTGGLTTGELIERLDIPPSTLAHHLRFLDRGGVIQQEKRGRFVLNRASFARIQSLAAYLLGECCAESGEDC